MGKRGPKCRATKLHRLAGTYREDRHGGRRPEAPGALLEPPSYLSAAQAARFREMLAMAPKGLLRRWDAGALAGYVVAESLLIEATEARKRTEGGLLDRGKDGQTVIGNLVKIQIRALASMKPYIVELGLSPTARSGMRLADDDIVTDEDRRWDELMNPKPPTAAEKRRWDRLMDRVSKTAAANPWPSREKAEVVTLNSAGPVAKVEPEPSRIIPEGEDVDDQSA